MSIDVRCVKCKKKIAVITDEGIVEVKYKNLFVRNKGGEIKIICRNCQTEQEVRVKN